ncbi:MAG TPA: phage holin family protein [Actinomycetota bacterium]|nr:phage holin family protein [Actinomycetota bacterium]
MRERYQRLEAQSRQRLNGGPALNAGVNGGSNGDPGTVPLMAHVRSEPPLPEVLSEAAQASKQLFTQELQLAKTEMTTKAKQAGKGAGLLGAAGITVLFAIAAFSAAAILGLALVLPAWLAALIVGVVYAVIAGCFAIAGRAGVRSATPLMPEQTVRTLGSLGGQLSRAWRRGQA